MSPLRALLFTAVAAAFILPVPAAVRAEDDDARGTDLSEKPIQLSLFDPVQIFPASTSVKGVRLSLLYGRNMNVKGVDVGIVSRTMKDFKGIQVGIVGLTGGDFSGVQWNHAANFVEGEFAGFQVSPLANITDGMRGFQLGMINVSENARGFQLGFINITEQLHGLQIGIINIARAKEKFSVLPLVNWSF